MSDTDKYEGHTEGKWIADGDDERGWAVRTPKHDDPYAFIERRNDDGEVVSLSEADAQLIADAPLLLAEVKRLRIIETAAQLYSDYCKERHQQMNDTPISFERWLDWMLVDDELGKMMTHYDQEVLDDMKSKATYYSPKGCGFFTDYSKLKEMIE